MLMVGGECMFLIVITWVLMHITSDWNYFLFFANVIAMAYAQGRKDTNMGQKPHGKC